MVVTACAMHDEVEDCFTAGADDVLTKPFGVVALRDKLEFWRRRLDDVAVAANALNRA